MSPSEYRRVKSVTDEGVVIGPFRFKVEYPSKMPRNFKDAWGICDYQHKVITVLRTPHVEDVDDTILHEILHPIVKNGLEDYCVEMAEAMGIPKAKRHQAGHDIQEVIVARTSKSIVSVLKANPKLAMYFAERCQPHQSKARRSPQGPQSPKAKTPKTRKGKARK